MPQKMPKDLEDLINSLDDPSDIERIYGRWNAYVAANENYEKKYQQQFGNLVMGNASFKENKVLPTPAEQMRSYTDLVREEAKDMKMGKYLAQNVKNPDYIKGNDIDQSQELGITWMKEYRETLQKEETQSKERDSKDERSSYDFKLAITHPDDIDKAKDNYSHEKDKDDYEPNYD